MTANYRHEFVPRPDFCRACGASVPPRDGEGTCPACPEFDPSCLECDIGPVLHDPRPADLGIGDLRMVDVRPCDDCGAFFPEDNGDGDGLIVHALAEHPDGALALRVRSVLSSTNGGGTV